MQLPSQAAGEKGIRVTAIGGGTGLSTLLKGLKRYVHVAGASAGRRSDIPVISQLTAIVTVTDDGGSSGRLRKELNMLPPGDLRNCIVALSDDDQLLASVFQYRFGGESPLSGHNFGNLFVAALTSITGDFMEAIRLASEILATRGRILPATTSDLQLEAVLADGTRIRGETNISQASSRIVRVELFPREAAPLPQALAAIAQADIITVGPGSLYTSLIPNLLVPGVAAAIRESKALKVFVCNLMTQPNESLGMSTADHLRAIQEHAGGPLFDYVLMNHAMPSLDLQAKYAMEGAEPLACDAAAARTMGIEVISGDYLIESGGIARHAADRIALDVLQLAARGPQVLPAAASF